MREKIARFMAGRCGTDNLNRFLSVVSLIIMIAAVIFNRSSAGSVLWLLAFALLVIVYARMLSRNLYKRNAENQKYLSLSAGIRSKLKVLRERWVQRKDYKFFTCPACHTALRVPRGKGKINIVCRKCGNSFRGKT